MVGNYSITLSCDQCFVLFKALPGQSKYQHHFCCNTCRIAYKMDLVARFWEKVQLGSVRDCWPWLAATNNKGYGQIRSRGRCFLAHRIAYELMWAPLPIPLNALHRCDNPPCCNPWHLFQGTSSDNVQDMLSKGRAYRGVPSHGESHPFAKLSNTDVAHIKHLYASGTHSRQQLANTFAVTYQHIDHIVKGRLRKHA